MRPRVRVRGGREVALPARSVFSLPSAWAVWKLPAGGSSAPHLSLLAVLPSWAEAASVTEVCGAGRRAEDVLMTCAVCDGLAGARCDRATLRAGLAGNRC